MQRGIAPRSLPCGNGSRKFSTKDGNDFLLAHGGVVILMSHIFHEMILHDAIINNTEKLRLELELYFAPVTAKFRGVHCKKTKERWRHGN
jgi:hypothetical protein